MDEPRKPRDIALLDAVDRCDRGSFEGPVWRVVREGRDPLEPSRSRGRWSDGSIEVLYTSLERDGAVAEIFSLLSSQPVFPSQIRWRAHRIEVRVEAALRIADLDGLSRLGVDVRTYEGRDYGKTQAIADAAFFLGFDGLLVPSARWTCPNLVLFTDRIAPAAIAPVETEPDPIDWSAWRRNTRR
jgi:RES domain-containing protein